MFSGDLLNERLRFWRKQQGLSIAEIADAAAVSIQDVHDWETGRAEPPPSLRYRLSEMMRGDASEQLSLRTVFVNGLRSYVSLIDVDDTRLIAASQGIRQLWPELAHAVGQPFLPQMTPEARSLMQDADFIRKIKRSEVVLASGASERAGRIYGGPSKRHKWTASFSSYGRKVIAEIWYDAELTTLDAGVHEIFSFSSIHLE